MDEKLQIPSFLCNLPEIILHCVLRTLHFFLFLLHVEALNEMYTSILVRLIKNIVKILGLIFVMLALDVKIALFSFLLLPFIIGLTILFKKISRATYSPYWCNIKKAKGKFVNVFKNFLTDIIDDSLSSQLKNPCLQKITDKGCQ